MQTYSYVLRRKLVDIVIYVAT